MDIFLVDDNVTFREHLKLFIEGHLNYKVVAEADDGEEFLKKKSIHADIILMDINMPKIKGVEATKYGMWHDRSLKIIAVSQYKDLVNLEELIGVGFKGFVSKTNLFRDLEKAIQTVMSGGHFFPDEIMK